MIKKLIRRIYHRLKKSVNSVKYSRQDKIFCIGTNKTGTTSMATIFRELEIPVASQRKAELLFKDLSNKNLKDFYKYVKYGGVAFQDIPFSLPNTFKILDVKFPDSKFILTIRDSPEVWYNSLTTYHAKLFGNGNIPNKLDLKNAKYVYPGWMWESYQLYYKTPEDDIYNKPILIQQYTDYNNSVLDYFKEQPEKLLVVNLKESNAAEKISRFLNSKKVLEKIPWKNKT